MTALMNSAAYREHACLRYEVAREAEAPTLGEKIYGTTNCSALLGSLKQPYTLAGTSALVAVHTALARCRVACKPTTLMSPPRRRWILPTGTKLKGDLSQEMCMAARLHQ